LTIHACYSWDVTLNFGFDSVTYETKKEYKKKNGKLLV
jgi:hypothetical protein